MVFVDSFSVDLLSESVCAPELPRADHEANVSYGYAQYQTRACVLFRRFDGME